MSQVSNSTCLYTKVRNCSGERRTFTYLGKHGKTLDDNETYLHPGNLITELAAKTSKRDFDALCRSLDDHHSLEIISTPAVHLYDLTRGETQILALQGGDLGMADPCWKSDYSSVFNDDE